MLLYAQHVVLFVVCHVQPNDVNLVDKDRGWSALHLACSDDKNADLAQVLMDCPR